ncbi:hypothetical protein M9Y10_023018 [Tritrichomonas musculus]|uniref:DUF3447 domain-containing protein n=1 Tax=Tritrichomonas musculus TaxID=1915356 RepID=A0ABR2KUI0_9EUKA
MYETAEEQLKDFQEIADFQEKLLNIDFSDSNNAISLFDEVLNSSLLKSKWTFRSILVSIYTCFLCRPHSNLDYVNLFIKFAQLPENPFKSDDYVLSFTNCYFIYQLYKEGLVTIDSIHSNSHRKEEMLVYFYPELKQNFPNSPLFKVQKRINYTNYDKIKQYVIDYYQSLTQKPIFNQNNPIKEESEKNENQFDEQSIFEKFIELRSIGHNPDPIATAIRSDDVDKMQKIFSQTNMPYDNTLKFSPFESCNYANNSFDLPTFIEYAAYFGSLKCFKFLYQQIPTLPTKTSRYAIAGGNYEIIHLCELGKAEFDADCYNLAIRFFRNEIVDYLEENLGFEKNISSASKSIVFYNLGQLISHKDVISKNPNEKDETGYTLLSLACLNGDLDIVNYLLTTFSDKININEQNTSKNRPLYYASAAGHLEIIKFLASNQQIDINAPNSGNYTALHCAAEKGHLNVVKYLCSLPNIDINCDCGRNFRPIDDAVLNGNMDIILYLISLPNIIIYHDSEYPTILQNAVYSRRLDIVELVFQLVDKLEDMKKLNESIYKAQENARTGGMEDIQHFLEKFEN